MHPKGLALIVGISIWTKKDAGIVDVVTERYSMKSVLLGASSEMLEGWNTAPVAQMAHEWNVVRHDWLLLSNSSGN